MAGGLTVLIMAAGEGTRMRSSTPKMLHDVCGRPLIAWPVAAAREAGADRVAVIVSPERDLSEVLPDGVEQIVQPEADGTGGAVRAAIHAVRESDTVVVLPGDHPLVSADVITSLVEAHSANGAAATVMTIELDDPGAYGRVVRGSGGEVERIVETKHAGDATPEERAIREVSTSTFAFEASALASSLDRISNQNAAGEYYLGDVLPAIRSAGGAVHAHVANDPAVNLGVNTRAELATAADTARRAILRGHMVAGVSVIDPGSTWIEVDVAIEPDAVIEPGTVLRGETRIGAGSVVGPQTTLVNATLGEGVTVLHSYLVDCDVDAGCTVGPFAYLRPGAHLAEGAKAGSFVEIKNSEIGPGAKVPHLSYVGDADVGAGANLGASTITANFDGRSKNRTKIGQRARISVHTSLVAPVDVGDDAYTGAGAVIREDVPPGALAVTDAPQRNIEGYTERRAQDPEEKDR